MVSRLPGVKKVKADHRTQLIEVDLDTERTSLEALKRKLDDIGFETV